jgi:hypothetical protein
MSNFSLISRYGKQEGLITPDMNPYVPDRPYVNAALRIARNLEASEVDWQRFADFLTNKYSKGKVMKSTSIEVSPQDYLDYKPQNGMSGSNSSPSSSASGNPKMSLYVFRSLFWKYTVGSPHCSQNLESGRFSWGSRG